MKSKDLTTNKQTHFQKLVEEKKQMWKQRFKDNPKLRDLLNKLLSKYKTNGNDKDEPDKTG